MPDERARKIYESTISCASNLKSILSTSIGPYGLDKLLVKPGNKLVVTNDGSTILKNLSTFHPVSRILNSVSETQDKMAGDGTTSVVILAAQLLEKAHALIEENVHASVLIRELGRVRKIVDDYLDAHKIRCGELRSAVKTALSSKVVSTVCDEMVALAVKAVEYDRLKVVKRLGSEMERSVVVDGYCIEVSDGEKHSDLHDAYDVDVLYDTLRETSVHVSGDRRGENEMKDGAVDANGNNDCKDCKDDNDHNDCKDDKDNKIDNACKDSKYDNNSKDSMTNTANTANEARDVRVTSSTLQKKYRVALLQYCLSAPKPNIDSKVEIEEKIDSIIREEREYVFSLVKRLKTSRVEVVLVQKSILRDSISELAEYFLNKLKIRYFVLEREVIEEIGRVFRMSTSSVSRTVTYDMNMCFFKDMVLMSETRKGVEEKMERLSIADSTRVGTLVVRASDNILLDETERCLNDAICVCRCLKDEPYIVPGGGSLEMNMCVLYENEIQKRLMSAFEAIPYYICKNAGLNFFRLGKVSDSNGIDCLSGSVEDMIDKQIVMPVKVARNYFGLAIETASFILSIDDILPVNQ